MKKVILLGDLKGHGVGDFAIELEKQLSVDSSAIRTSFDESREELYCRIHNLRRHVFNSDKEKYERELFNIRCRRSCHTLVSFLLSEKIKIYATMQGREYIIIDDLENEADLIFLAKEFSSNLISARIRDKNQCVQMPSGVGSQLYDAKIEVAEGDTQKEVEKFIKEFNL